MNMSAPKEIPFDAGMCAVRIAVAETKQEAEFMMFSPNPAWPLYRVTVWQYGRAYFGYWNGEVLLTERAFLDVRRLFPDQWVELQRA